jgi:hypothetical protein
VNLAKVQIKGEKWIDATTVDVSKGVVWATFEDLPEHFYVEVVLNGITVAGFSGGFHNGPLTLRIEQRPCVTAQE